MRCHLSVFYVALHGFFKLDDHPVKHVELRQKLGILEGDFLPVLDYVLLDAFESFFYDRVIEYLLSSLGSVDSFLLSQVQMPSFPLDVLIASSVVRSGPSGLYETRSE